MRRVWLVAFLLIAPATVAFAQVSKTLTVNVYASNGTPLTEPRVCMRLAGPSGTPRSVASAIEKSKPKEPEIYLSQSYRTAFHMTSEFGPRDPGFSGDVQVIAMAEGRCPSAWKVTYADDVPDPPQIALELGPVDQCADGIEFIGGTGNSQIWGGKGLSCTSLRKNTVLPKRSEIEMHQQPRGNTPDLGDPRRQMEPESTRPSQPTPEGATQR